MTYALSIVFPVYNQPQMLRVWFERWEQQQQKHRDQCEVVVVDDCSHPHALPPAAKNIRVLRVEEDRPWNQGMARNLGVIQASASVVLLLDVDMTIPPNTLQLFVEAALKHNRGEVQRPILQHAKSRKLDASSPNVHLMTKDDFLRVRGYDARYAGHKGWSDCTLLNVIQRKYHLRQRKDLVLTLHHDDDSIMDAQVKTLNRNTAQNRKLHEEHMALMKSRSVDYYIQTVSKEMVDLPWRRVR